MDFRTYQTTAAQTTKLDLHEPKDAIAATFGLAHEAGSIANIYKRSLRDSIPPQASKEYLKVELGDLLWYAAAVATAFKLDLQEIAESNLRRTKDRYTIAKAEAFTELPTFDADFPETERFPRRLVFKFAEAPGKDGELTASMTLVEARPNPFMGVPLVEGSGFQIGAQLGDSVNDNSRRVDGYRFHDALHIGFLAVLGWSPIIRRLLQLKRRSKPDTDREQDGARAAYAEEGLTHVLARMSDSRKGYASDKNIDGDTLALVKFATAELEPNELPGWLWTRAIVQGFAAMNSLVANSGGYLIADLEGRNVTHENHYVSR